VTARFADRVAVVTGAAGGIGAAIAHAVAGEGGTVACLDIDADGAARTAAEIGPPARAFPVDLTDAAALEAVVAEMTQMWPRVHAVFANAGGSRGEAIPFLEMDAATWDRMIDRNLRTAFTTGSVFARHLAAAGGGAMVFTTSQLSLVTRPGLAHYAAAKGGVAQLVKGMAVDLADHGIRVNAVAPGPTRTPGNAAWFARPEVEREHERLIPLHRVAESSEIAGAALYLASDAASFTTGATVVVDGGYTIV
jgi:NAD(P)-dependent dehydrogenase (short-subunit alcohol dehydrogenase family)